MAGGEIEPPAILVHSAEQAQAAARAAVSLGAKLFLRSPPDAVAHLGIGWYLALASLLRERHPGLDLTLILDCADEPGTTLAALRRGIGRVRFCGPAEMAAKLAAIAAQTGAALDTDERPPLDLAKAEDAEAECRRWLAPRARCDQVEQT